MTSVPSPVSSTLIVHSSAGRTWSGSSEAAPSEITVGCSGTLESAPYSVSPRLLRLQVDRVARRDERRDVGDRVVDDVAVAVALDVQRLVEVHRRRRVDRDERAGRSGRGRAAAGRGRGRGRRLTSSGNSGVTWSSSWMRAIPVAQLRAPRPVVGARTWTTRLAACQHPSQAKPVRPALACRRADPAAAERGQDSRPARQAARPRHALLPALGDARRQVLDALVELCRGGPRAGRAPPWASPPRLADLVARNADLPSAPTARADHVYSGVLYDALDLPGLPADARRRATSRVAIVVLAVRDGPPRRPHPGVPALRRRLAARPRPGGGRLARRTSAVGARGPRPRAARRPQVHDVRRVLAARARPRPAGGHRAGAPRVGRPAHGGQSLQQGHQGPAGARPAGGRREPRVGARPGRRPLERLGWTVEAGAPGRSGTPIDVVVTEV